jgi:signal transduction histidine kinase/ligand-binding sensor domain-containing protein
MGAVSYRWVTSLLCAAAAVGLTALPVRSAHLPFRAYGAAEGLAGDSVRYIRQDARGFLWLATNAGVSRFDGHDFRNYGPADGLPFASARKVVEALDGTIYVLGGGRVARLRNTPGSHHPEFEPLDRTEIPRLVGDVLDIVAGADGALVLAGTEGAVMLRGDRVESLDLGPIHLAELGDAKQVWAAAIEADGTLWAARTYGITRIGRDGKPLVLPLPRERLVSSGWGWLPSMSLDRSGRAWLLTVETGAWRLAADQSGQPAIAEVIDSRSLGTRFMRGLHQGADGTLWIATSDHGLIRGELAASGWRFAALGPGEGLPDVEISSVSTDTQGNLWAGTAVAGAVRLAVDGLTSWGAAEGLTPYGISAILDDPGRGLVVVTPGLHFASLRNEVIVERWDAWPATRSGWGSEQLVTKGNDGRLWLATADGLAMYPPGTRVRDLGARRPERLLTQRDGLPGLEVHRVFAASDGTIWFGLIHVANGVCRVGADGTGVRCFGAGDGLTDPAYGDAFAEDAGGHLWVGLYEGGIFRFRDGTFECWPRLEAGRQIAVRSIRRDEAGRLWVAGSPGLLRIDGAESPQPSFRRFTSDDGLASNDTVDTADDRFGRVYVAGTHGLDCMTADGGMIRRFTVADGLPSNQVGSLHRDSRGDVWVGTSRGLARLVPRTEGAPAKPRVFLTAVSVAGTPRETSGPLRLSSSERTVEFAFTSPGFRAGETMRFQWRLDGSSADWSPPGPARAISFAALGPGRYRFDVRAVDGEGRVGAPESFRPPFWRRGWFAALLALALAGSAALAYRVRVARLIELERVRMRIATDLHDDVGASLSQIAVLSQYASRQAARGAPETGASLERITELAGTVVDAMSDVVWSINPSRDRMSDLVHRMRRFAVDLFSDGGTVLRLDLPENPSDERLDPEARRQVYLVFKEALRNAARHADAREVEASLVREGTGLVLAVRDDGGGIDGRAASDGAGLESMQQRAGRIGGTLDIRPRDGGGTEVRLRIPARRPGFLATWTGPGGPKAP